jgi:hypothetical protein
VTIYLVGCIIALGFHIGIYWPDEEFHRQCRGAAHSSEGGLLLAIVVSMLTTVLSWVSIVAMITNVAYQRDKKNWNL